MRRLVLPTLAIISLLGSSRAHAQEDSNPALLGSATEFPAIAQHEDLLRLVYEADADSAHADSALGLPLPRYGRWVGITKWLTLASAVGFGALGFSLNESADDDFERLEALCNEDPPNCRAVNPDGSYQDPLLESLYQDVTSKDRTARASLIAGQLSFGASVVLFIVDFQKSSGPGDIPYEPEEERSALRLTARPGEIALRYYFE